jgi:hypothetical protein
MPTRSDSEGVIRLRMTADDCGTAPGCAVTPVNSTRLMVTLDHEAAYFTMTRSMTPYTGI